MRALLPSTPPSLPLALLAGFVGIATLLPFVAVPLPLWGALAAAPLILSACDVSMLGRRDRTAHLSLIDGIALVICVIAITSFATGVMLYCYSREAGLAAFGFVVSLLLILTVPRIVQTL